MESTWNQSDAFNTSTVIENSTCSSENFTDTSDTVSVNVFFAIFIPTLCFLITIGNLGTIIAFWKVPSLLEKPSELLILSLSCADFITGFVVIPLFCPVYITPGYWPFKEMTCLIFNFFMDLAVHASLFSLCMISLDRFLLVSKEYPQYVRIQTHFRIKIALLIGWIFSLLTGCVEVATWEIAKELDESASMIDYTKVCKSPPRRMKQFALTFFLSLYLSPVLLVCGLSTAFFCLLYKRLRLSWGMRAESQLPKVKHSPNSKSLIPQVGLKYFYSIQHKNRYFKPAVTLLGLVTAMAICMLPYSLYVIAVEVFCSHCANNDILYNLLLLQFCNACLDPLMYALTQKKIRTFYKAQLIKLKKRSHLGSIIGNFYKKKTVTLSGVCRNAIEMDTQTYTNYEASL